LRSRPAPPRGVGACLRVPVPRSAWNTFPQYTDFPSSAARRDGSAAQAEELLFCEP